VRKIKYRQKLKDAYVSRYGEVFHYWGYIDGGFVSPVGLNVSSEESEQFTGLQDNSGVDIYEGDIVESDYYLPDFTEKAEVRYELHDNFGRFGFASGEQDAFCYGNLTVIGNIHENKELLCED
jgi:hypothetical protein